MAAEPRPHRRQAAERFAPGQLVTALDALRLGGGEQPRNVVAVLGVTGREDLTSGGITKDPLARRIAAAKQIGGDAHPVVVHVDAQRCRWRVHREAPRFARDLGEGEAGAAVLLRQRHLEVARGLELVEVLLAERVVPVVLGGPSAAS